MQRTAISLFCSSGIGDLGLKANGIQPVIANELLPERMALFSANNPETKCFTGDIWKLSDEIISYYKSSYCDAPFLILATPPCQGMSSNGIGKLLNNSRKGLRPKMDDRNRLVIPALKIMKALQPEWIIFENVPNMTSTYILDEKDELIKIPEYIAQTLGDSYIGRSYVIDAADYGIPQHRKRLIIIYTRSASGKSALQANRPLIPEPTHSRSDTLLTRHWVTLREAIGTLPELRAEKGKNSASTFHPLHRVPLLDEKKLFWIDNTPEGDTAFNNQCINPACLYKHNRTHTSSHDNNGINKTSSETPLYCERCGALLPRPWVEDKETGKKRLMKGYVSAYKRMDWDEPASTLTQNFQYACSDNKLHPSQSRVLSLYEGLILQSIADYDYSFLIDGKPAPDGLIRDSIGESVPPKVIDLICKHIIAMQD